MFSPVFFSSSCHCLKALAERFVGSVVAHPPAPGLVLGAIKDTALTAAVASKATPDIGENARCC